MPRGGHWLPVAAAFVACSPAPKFRPAWGPVPGPTAANAKPVERSATEAGPHVAAMHEWLGGVSRLRDAVVRGLPSEVVREAARLDRDLDHLREAPTEWQSSLQRLRRQTSRLDDGASLAEAGVVIAEMAETCGACHESSRATTAVEAALPEPALPADDSRAHLMQHHGWGTERMWEGLVIPSERRWIRGTTFFSMAPACEGSAMDERCAQARALARRAHTVTDRSGRVELLGEILSTCAGCHAEQAGPAQLADR